MGPRDGDVVTKSSEPGQSVVELEVGSLITIRDGNRYVGYLEVQASPFAKYMRWVTVDDAVSAEVVEFKVQLQVGYDLDLLVMDQHGRVAAGAVVLANSDPSGQQPGHVADWRVEADQDGFAELRGLAPGEWTLQAGEWKDWGPSEQFQLKLGPSDLPPKDIALVVERWPQRNYSSGTLEFPVGWGPIAFLEECEKGGRTYAVHGSEFFLRIPHPDQRTLRAVNERGGARSACFRIVGGQHGLRVDLLPE